MTSWGCKFIGDRDPWKLLYKIYCMCMYKCTYNIFYTITSSVREEICDENSANKNSNNSKVCVLLTRIKKKKFYTQDQTICLRFKVKFESQVTASRLWATYHVKSHGKKWRKKILNVKSVNVDTIMHPCGRSK